MVFRFLCRPENFQLNYFSLAKLIQLLGEKKKNLTASRLIIAGETDKIEFQ